MYLFFSIYLFKGNVDYFICTDIDEFVISVLSFEINLIYPYSCDFSLCLRYRKFSKIIYFGKL